MAEATGLKEIIKPENLVYKKTKVMTDNILSYCPGCGHGTAHRISGRDNRRGGTSI